MLARVRHLHLRARYLTDAILMGEHRSRRVGAAVEFADYQQYLPGMDIRGLDWRVWGRTDRYVVKRFEAETELPCSVVLDLSGDLLTGTSGAHGYPDLEGSKAGYGITLAATLLYWLHRHGEPIGLELIAGDGVLYSSLPCRGGRSHLQRCLLSLASARAGGVAGLSAALRRVGERVRRRSWVAVITDGMEEPSEWLPALQAYGKRGADVRLIHLFDPKECALEFSSPALFYSHEGGEELAVDPVGARDVFREVLGDYLREVESGVVRAGGRYVRASTAESLEKLLHTVVLDGRHR